MGGIVKKLNGYCLLTRLCGRVSRSGVELKVRSYKNEVFFIVIWTEQSIIFCRRDSTKGDGKW